MRRAKDGQSAGSRRPRAEWMIQRDTHPALITEAEALAIIGRLEAKESATRRRGSEYLLSGLIVRPDGAAWHGDRGSYTTKGGAIEAELLERLVLEHLAADLSTAADRGGLHARGEAAAGRAAGSLASSRRPRPPWLT
jgi:site-specific DNA recombinase